MKQSARPESAALIDEEYSEPPGFFALSVSDHISILTKKTDEFVARHAKSFRKFLDFNIAFSLRHRHHISPFIRLIHADYTS